MPKLYYLAKELGLKTGPILERLRERVAEKLPFESKEPNSYFNLTGETIPGCTKDGISTEVLSAQKTTCVHEITTKMFSWPQLEFTKLNNENPLGPTVPHPNIHRCRWVLKLKVILFSLEKTQFLLVEYFLWFQWLDWSVMCVTTRMTTCPSAWRPSKLVSITTTDAFRLSDGQQHPTGHR